MGEKQTANLRLNTISEKVVSISEPADCVFCTDDTLQMTLYTIHLDLNLFEIWKKETRQNRNKGVQ